MSTGRLKTMSDMEGWGRASDVTRSLCSHLVSSTRGGREVVDKGATEDGRDAKSLPYFQACLFASVLEDIVTQLRILDECNPEIRISKVRADLDALLARKYGVEEEASKDDLENVDPKNLHCPVFKLNKLQSDRNFVLQVLTDLYLSLSKERKFEALQHHVCAMKDKHAHLTALLEGECKNRLLRRELNRQLRLQRNHMKSVLYDTNIEIERLKSHLEDSELKGESRGRYVDGWQRSRTEQHLQTIYDREVVPLQVIEEFKRKMDQEQRIHTEIEVLMNIIITEVLDKVEEWMRKYDKDIEDIDLKIQIRKNEYESTYEQRLELEETIETHAELIRNWVAYKEEREREREYRERMHRAAVSVQAWWRGLLVRRLLGPYKPTKRNRTASKPK